MTGFSIAAEMEEEVNKEVRKISLKILRGLTKVTPVDTGRAKGNWFVGINSSNRSVSDERRVSAAIAEGNSNIARAKAIKYPEIVVSNNLPYIEKLNDGHSKQAPKKFVELEIARVIKGN